MRLRIARPISVLGFSIGLTAASASGTVSAAEQNSPRTVSQSPSPTQPGAAASPQETPSPQPDAARPSDPAAPPSDPTPTRPSFVEWLDGVKAEALARGIQQHIVDAAFADVTEPVPVIIERDRTQAETVLTLETYLNRQLTPRRIRTGRERMAQYKTTLERVSAAYGVPARIVGGVWGLESNFGQFSGVRPTIAALATLAWDPRRGTYFRKELFNALEIVNRGDIDLSQLRGSWAGAMGQPQFMPSSYLQFAEDFDKDGKRDIWATPVDVFASIANYLKGHGWTASQTWGREVKLTREAARAVSSTVARRTGSCQATRDMTVALPVAEWRRLGVRSISGGPLPTTTLTASLVSGASRHFLVYGNYDALLEYNCAHAYALSVALLSERIAPATAAAPLPRKGAVTPRAQRKSPRVAPRASAPPASAPRASTPRASAPGASQRSSHRIAKRRPQQSASRTLRKGAPSAGSANR